MRALPTLAAGALFGALGTLAVAAAAGRWSAHVDQALAVVEVDLDDEFAVLVEREAPAPRALASDDELVDRIAAELRDRLTAHDREVRALRNELRASDREIRNLHEQLARRAA